MTNLTNHLFGKTIRERIANGVTYVFVVALVLTALQLKWALKSPNPAEWNSYSVGANDYLYTKFNAAKPDHAVVVSHRAGDVPGIADASPLERLTHNYAAGQRLFEMDFSWTSDDQLVVKHDWKNRSTIPTLEQFLNESPGQNASLQMVYNWLSEHDDAFIVTDCKKQSLRGAARIRMERPDLVPQFILQIYQYKDYDLVQSQGFRNVILTLYRCLSDAPADEISDFVQSHDLFAVTIPKKRSNDAELILKIRDAGVPIYAHTVNDPAEALEMLSLGINGVYSDALVGHHLVASKTESSLR